eukprot:14005654-Alexandrium_andersonii.AAC.1
MGGRAARRLRDRLHCWGERAPTARRRRCGAAGRMGALRAGRGHPWVCLGRAGEGQGRAAGRAGIGLHPAG